MQPVANAQLNGFGKNGRIAPLDTQKDDDVQGRLAPIGRATVLPDVLLPFAERLFAWFPEVLVSLGHPALQELFELPPMAGAEMTFEESGEFKLVKVRLRRRKRSRPHQSIAAPRNGEERGHHLSGSAQSNAFPAEQRCESPFSRSRALVKARSEPSRGHQQQGSVVANVVANQTTAARPGPRFAPPERTSGVCSGPTSECWASAAQPAQRQPPSPGADEENVLLSPLTPESPFCLTAGRVTRPVAERGAGSAAKGGAASGPASGSPSGPTSAPSSGPISGPASRPTIGSATMSASGLASGPTRGTSPASDHASRLASGLTASAATHMNNTTIDLSALAPAQSPLQFDAYHSSPATPAGHQDSEPATDVVPTAAGPRKRSSVSGERARAAHNADPGSPKFSSPGSHNPWAGTSSMAKARLPSDVTSKTDSDPGRESVADSGCETACAVLFQEAAPFHDGGRVETGQAATLDAVTDTSTSLRGASAANAPQATSPVTSDVQPSPMTQPQARGAAANPTTPQTASPALSDVQPTPRTTNDSAGGSSPSFEVQAASLPPSAQGTPVAAAVQTPPSPSSPASTPAEDGEGAGGDEEEMRATASSPASIRAGGRKLEIDDSGERVDAASAAQRRTAGSADFTCWSAKGDKVTANKPPLAPSQAGDAEPGVSPVVVCVGGEPRSAGSKTRPLIERRNMKLQTPFLDRSSGGGEPRRGMRGDSLPEEMSPPAVLPPTPKGAKTLLRPLPGAFPTRRTLIIFDWDDTLCPTSWIRQLLKDHIADSAEWALAGNKDLDYEWRDQVPAWFGQPLPDEPEVRDAIGHLQNAIIDVIIMAQSLGSVCIVTNAHRGWVEKTTKKWLPKLKQYILGHGTRPRIQVLYGQQEYCRPRAGSKASELPWVDDLGELTWWKKAAMSSALDRIDDIYRVAPAPMSPGKNGGGSGASGGIASSTASGAATGTSSNAAGSGGLADSGETLAEVPWQADSNTKDLVNLLSIGDSEAEMQSAKLAALLHQRELRSGCAPGGQRQRSLSAPPGPRVSGRPWVKTLKFWEAPSLDQIVEQLGILTKSLPQLVAAREHMRLDPEDLPSMLPMGMQSVKLVEYGIEARLRRQLRTQTI